MLGKDVKILTGVWRVCWLHVRTGTRIGVRSNLRNVGDLIICPKAKYITESIPDMQPTPFGPLVEGIIRTMRNLRER